MKLLQIAAVLLLGLAARPAAAYSLQPYQRQAIEGTADSVAVGDINGDGRDDIALTTKYDADGPDDYKLFVYFQNADGTLQAPRKFDYGSLATLTGLALADLDRDGRKEVIVGHSSGLTVFRGTYVRGKLVIQSHAHPLSHDVQTLAVLDVNRDGNLDIVGQRSGGGVTVFIGDGHGGISRDVEIAMPVNGFDDIKAGDFNGDGFTDLAVLVKDTYVFYNDGSDDFSPPTVINPYPDDFYPLGSLASGDFNADGRDDLGIVIDGKHVALYLQDADGALLAPQSFTSSDPTAMVGTDIDLDGKDDVVAGHPGGMVGFYLQGAGGMGTEGFGSVPYSGWIGVQGLAVGDVNGDSCPDIVNTSMLGLVIYHGSDCHPVADLAVSIGLTSTVAAIRLQNHGGADAEMPQADVTLSITHGSLSVGSLPAGCTMQSQTTAIARIRCDMPTLAAAGSTTVLLPLSTVAADVRATLRANASVTTTTVEVHLQDNMASTWRRLTR